MQVHGRHGTHHSHSQTAAAAAAAASNPIDVLLATAGYDHTIRFWEALSGACYRTIQHPDSQVNRLVISPDRRFLAAAGNPRVRLYDVNSGNTNPIVTLEGHTANVTGIAFSASSTWVATSSEDGTVKVWDIRTGTVQRDYDHRAPVNDVCAHPNQAEIISCNQAGSMIIWDLTENACTHELVPEEDVPIHSVAVSSDCTTLVAGNNRGNVYVWRMPRKDDFSDLRPVHKFQAHTNYLTRCSLSYDQMTQSILLATCSADATVKIWNLSDSEFSLRRTLIGHQRWVWDCAFSADSAFMVTASSDNSARLWDLSSGETIRQYNGHNKATVCVALNDATV
ncbi:quinon protein alcohol dehydrogenase-like superfamily [Syncephalis plumigaleata]|nr:quinon protein alcohol dehydrogenase-like superfamily [Syncephalis plumigaleata]